MPLSARFTRSTSRAWSAGDRFLCKMPMPPARAMAMAARPSVTESMAALTRGTCSGMVRVSLDRTLPSVGSTSL